MSNVETVPSAQSDPVDAVKEILEGYEQIQDLRVPEGGTETIPENEVWYVYGEIDVEGELVINGGLTNAALWGTESVDLTVGIGRKQTIESGELLAAGDVTIEGELTVEGELVTDDEVLDNPVIDFWDSVTQKAKENQTNPAIYVHSSGEEGLNRFSADRGTLEETETVLASVWVLGNSKREARKRARQYRNAVVRIFKSYMNDNFRDTEFHNIEPVNATDFRSQHIPRQTDHYIYTVEIEAERLR